jgi:RimJ/RimL family protein N-acetyltransferase
MSLEETEVALKSMIQHWHRHGFGRWAVEDSASERLIGYAGIRSLDGRAELVYLLAKEYWGRGLGTECANACLKYAIEEKGFDEVVALTRPLNSKSRRVMEKIGMHHVRNANYFGIEVVEYAISAMDYKALSREEDGSIRELDGR